jgi:metallophosphoesterase (TIGR00282 family)
MNTVNILCIGDVVGHAGRGMIADHLQPFIADHQIELVVCNAENAAGGSGLTAQIFSKLRHHGVDVVTLGDHVFKRVDIAQTLNKDEHIIRPANLSPLAAGNGWTEVLTKSGKHKVAVGAILGQTYMGKYDSPWQAADTMISAMGDTPIKIIDFHAEATSEKIAMGWHVDGRVSVCFGTHTHVATADCRVLPGGTAYITDVGMTGPHDGILGRKKDCVLHNLRTSMPIRFDVSEGDPRLCGLLASVDIDTGKATAVERIEIAGRTAQSG